MNPLDLGEKEHAERRRFNEILDALPIYVVLISRDYHIPFANRYFREHFGEARGRRCYEYLFGRESPCTTCESFQPFETGRPHRWEWTGPDQRQYMIYDTLFTEVDGAQMVLEIGVDVTERKELERRTAEAEARFRGLFEESPAGIYRTRPDGTILEANPALVRMLGYASFEELAQVKAVQLYADPAERERWQERLKETGRVSGYEMRLRRKGGAVFWARHSAVGVRDPSGAIEHYQGILEDVTERKRAEEQVLRLERLLRSIREIDRLIVHEHEAPALLQRSCDTLVHASGFRMAWIGLASETDKRIRPVARAGQGAAEYLDEVTITWDEAPTGLGPTGTATRTGAVVVNRDTDTDARMAPWRDAARARGFLSSIALPIAHGGKTFGVLSSYADRADAFGEEEVTLLRDVVDDLASALRGLEAERALREREAMLARVERSAHIGSWEFDFRTERLEVSDEVLRIHGHSRAEFDGSLATVIAWTHPEDREDLEAAIRGVREKGERLSLERRIVRPDGTIRHVHSADEIDYDLEGKPLRVVGFLQDITERKLAEEVERQRTRRFSTQAAALAEIVAAPALVVGDVESVARTLTECAARSTGCERANVWLFSADETELRCIDSYEATPRRHSSGAVLRKAQFRPEFEVLKRVPYVDADDALNDPRTAGYAEEYVRPLGITSMLDVVVRLGDRHLGLVCLEHVGKAHHWEDDEIAFAGRLADKIAVAIAHRDRLAALRRAAALQEHGSDLVAVIDREGIVRHVSPSLRQIGGYEPDEMLGRPFLDWLHPDDLAIARDGLAALLAAPGAKRASEYRYRHKDGGWRVLASVAKNVLDDPAVNGIVVSARDVTEQRMAEQRIRESEERLRAIFEKAKDVIYTISGEGTFLSMSPAVEPIAGWKPDEWLGRPFAPIVVDEDRERAMALLRATLDDRQPRHFEMRIRKREGGWWDGEFNIGPLDVGGKTILLGIGRDVTERKRAEEQARLFFEQDLAGHYVSAPDGRLLACNNAFAHMLGFASAEEATASRATALYAKSEARGTFVARVAAERRVDRLETELRRKDGTSIQVIESAVGVFGGDPPALRAIHGFLIDDTQRRRAETQLRQAQKLKAVGLLAGGVAHDFNNVLGVILGYGELLLRHATETQRGKLQQIVQAAQRGAALTRQLLAFSRRQIVEPRILDLNALLADLQKMLGRLIGEDVELAIVPGANLGRVSADPGQLEQVVMNLSVNARDAMPDGGLLRIETANVELDAGYAASHEPMPPGRYVLLAVSDTGCGIEKELLDRIFEPFFTTKEAGRGTGLGLATVYGIVKQAGGFIWVYSEVGRGTSFKIYLPRVDSPVDERRPEEAVALARGSETILLVEDESSLRMITREILEENGYRVVEAGHGAEAIESAGRHAGPIHLLVTDVVMPGMNGRALAEALKAVRPETKVLYMSGYTDDVIARRGVLEPGTLLIEKPFTAPALLRRVREALR